MCTFFQAFNTVDGKSNQEGRKFCAICAEWKVEITPEGKDRTSLNSGCHLKVNEDNDCPFFSGEKVSDDRFNKKRTACKLRLAK